MKYLEFNTPATKEAKELANPFENRTGRPLDP